LSHPTTILTALTLTHFQVSGRIIIDTQAFNRFNPHRSENYDDLHESDYTVSEVLAFVASTINNTRKNNFAGEEVSPEVKLTEEAHIICKSTLLGYSLKLLR